MTSASDFYARAITRRRFGQWGLVAVTAGVAGCGAILEPVRNFVFEA